MKLRDGDTQHIGEVYQLLLGFVGEELFKAVEDPRRRGSVLTHGCLENSVHAGHSLTHSSVGREGVTRRPLRASFGGKDPWRDPWVSFPETSVPGLW